jgi:hypothetical protein
LLLGRAEDLELDPSLYSEIEICDVQSLLHDVDHIVVV